MSHSDKTLIPELTHLAKDKPSALHQLQSSLNSHLEKQNKWGISEEVL